MAITYVNYAFNASLTGNNPDPEWTSLDIGTRTNGLLVVFSYGYIASHTTMTLTYGGDTMTECGHDEHTSAANFHHYLHYLANPSNGSNTLDFEFNGTLTGSIRAIAFWFDGVDQTTPLHIGSTTAEGNGTDITVNITPTNDNTVVVSAEHSWVNETPVVGSGETEIFANYQTGHGEGASYDVQTTAESQDMNWSTTGTDDWVILAASFNAAAAADEKRPELLIAKRQIHFPRSRM